MLPLTFNNKADYELVKPDDRVAIVGLESFAPGVVGCSLYSFCSSLGQKILFSVPELLF